MSGRLLVLTNRRDLSADPVINELTLRSVVVDRLNIEDALTHGTGYDSGPLDDVDISAVWWRQFVPEHGSSGSSALDQPAAIDSTLIQRRQWASWLSLFEGRQIMWMNEPWSARRAENKIVQLRTAANSDFSLPNTLITNDPTVARDFDRDNEATVIKSLATSYYEFSDSSFVFTTPFHRDLLADAQDWRAQPVVVQALIDGDSEVRVIYVAGQTFAARRQRTTVDWRLSPEYEWSPLRLDELIVQSCTQYAEALGLDYVALDFIRSKGVLHFLEANQAGEFSFVDRVYRGAVTQCLADTLAAFVE